VLATSSLQLRTVCSKPSTPGVAQAQLQRIQPVVALMFEQAVHRRKALQGFQVKLVAAQRQLMALNPAQAQSAGQVGVFKRARKVLALA
jgi:hypothetical protein